MEIERKYLIDRLPENLEQYECKHIEQGYLNTDPLSASENQMTNIH